MGGKAQTGRHHAVRDSFPDPGLLHYFILGAGELNLPRNQRFAVRSVLHQAGRWRQGRRCQIHVETS